jgi:hypothetical protein
MDDRDCARQVIDQLLENGAKRLPPDLMRIAGFAPPPFDELQTRVVALLEGRAETSVQEVATALGLAVQRIARALVALGWTRHSKRIGSSRSDRKWVYRRPGGGR